MRSYLIDEIGSNDIKKIKEFLKKEAISSSMDSIFWIKIDEELLTQKQLQHKECAPYVCAIELGPSWLKAEFFVRSHKNIRCTCSGYCTFEQRNFIISYINRMIDTLDVRT